MRNEKIINEGDIRFGRKVPGEEGYSTMYYYHELCFFIGQPKKNPSRKSKTKWRRICIQEEDLEGFRSLDKEDRKRIATHFENGIKPNRPEQLIDTDNKEMEDDDEENADIDSNTNNNTSSTDNINDSKISITNKRSSIENSGTNSVDGERRSNTASTQTEKNKKALKKQKTS